MTTAQQRTLTIERLHNHYMVPDEVPGDMRARCQATLATSLERTLAVALEQSFSGEDPSLWFVRELNVRLSVESRIEDSRVGDIWAREVARVLVETLESEEQDVLYFPDRATYLAQFLLDLLSGGAWDRWYYSTFDGLRMLPLSAVLRSAILGSDYDGLRALRLLSEHQLCSLVRTLNISDAQSILSTFAKATGVCNTTDCLSLLAKHWQVALGFAVSEEERRALSLFLAVTRERPDSAGENLREAALAACRLASLLDRHPEDAAVITAICERSLAALYIAIGNSAEFLAPLLKASDDALNEILLLMGEYVTRSPTRRELRFTAYGGVFLLLPFLNDFPWSRATVDWKGLDSTSPAALVRLLVLAKCFGKERVQSCMRDPVVRDLLQIPPSLFPQAISAWQTSLSKAHLQSLMQANCVWHDDNGGADLESLLLTQVPQKGAPVKLLLDDAYGVWLNVEESHRRLSTALPLHLDLLEPQELFCHNALREQGREAFPQALVLPLADASEDKLPSPSNLARDLNYLGLPCDLAISRSFNLALSVVTQGIVRRFAAQLPGFNRSSLEYIRHNFLDCAAAVQQTEERIVVSLAPPPLHLVLAKAGMNRRSYSIDGRTCAIFPEG